MHPRRWRGSLGRGEEGRMAPIQGRTHWPGQRRRAYGAGGETVVRDADYRGHYGQAGGAGGDGVMPRIWSAATCRRSPQVSARWPVKHVMREGERDGRPPLLEPF